MSSTLTRDTAEQLETLRATYARGDQFGIIIMQDDDAATLATIARNYTVVRTDNTYNGDNIAVTELKLMATNTPADDTYAIRMHDGTVRAYHWDGKLFTTYRIIGRQHIPTTNKQEKLDLNEIRRRNNGNDNNTDNTDNNTVKTYIQNTGVKTTRANKQRTTQTWRFITIDNGATNIIAENVTTEELTRILTQMRDSGVPIRGAKKTTCEEQTLPNERLSTTVLTYEQLFQHLQQAGATMMVRFGKVAL